MEQILEQLLPLLREIVITIGIPLGLVLARQYIARIKDKNLGDALDRAVTNAAGEVINKLGGKAVVEEIKPTDPTVKLAAADIPRSNPEGVKHFNVSERELQDKIVKKIGVLTAPALSETIVIQEEKK